MQRRIRRGRPRNFNANRVTISNTNDREFISDSKLARDLYNLIANQANFKNITITGSKQRPRVPQSTASKIDIANQILRQTYSQQQIQEIYFLRSENKEFSLVEQHGQLQLIDNTQYENLIPINTYEGQYEQLIKILNLVIKQLDKDFAKIFKILVDIYLCRPQLQTKDDAIETIIKLVRDQNCTQFNYLREWENKRLITQETRYLIKKEKFQQIQAKIQRRSIIIQQKYTEALNQEFQEMEQDRKTKPIDFFVSKLICLLDDYLSQIVSEVPEPEVSEGQARQQESYSISDFIE